MGPGDTDSWKPGVEISFQTPFKCIYIKEWIFKTLLYSMQSEVEFMQHYCKVAHLKVHKNENFFGSDFEFYSFSLLVLLEY